MEANGPKVLLIAENPMEISLWAKRLDEWACEIHFASSCKAAKAFLRKKQFDVVLSQFRLRDGSSYPLAALLAGSNTTLVYSYPVEAGCWWLPAIKNGQSCWGSLAMRPSEFMVFLDAILREISSRQIASQEQPELFQSESEVDHYASRQPIHLVEPVNVEDHMSTQRAVLTVDPSERRRSRRFHHIMPLFVRGDEVGHTTFWEDTFTLSISAHGVLVLLAADVAVGQTLLLVNPENWMQKEGRVARLAHVGFFDGRVAQVGIEFAEPALEFWPDDAPPRTASASS
jgi:hypothetical protein